MVVDNAWDYMQELATSAGIDASDHHEIDQAIAASSRCPNCGKSMKYTGFHQVDGRARHTIIGIVYSNYRAAFAYCEDCKIAQEF